VASIGDNCLDVYVGPPGIRAVGGNAVNVAVNIRRAGYNSAYLGAVADDEAGAQIRRTIEAAGVQTRIQTLPGRTAVTRLRLLPGGEREFLHEDFGVGLDYRPTERELDSLEGGQHVHCAGLSDPMSVVSAINGRGLAVSYDFSTHPWPGDLRGLDIAFFSIDPPRSLALIREAVAAGAWVAVVTFGPQGSLAWDGRREFAVPALPIEPLDTPAGRRTSGSHASGHRTSRPNLPPLRRLAPGRGAGVTEGVPCIFHLVAALSRSGDRNASYTTACSPSRRQRDAPIATPRPSAVGSAPAVCLLAKSAHSTS
jgi:fructoselysine 6-kinase